MKRNLRLWLALLCAVTAVPIFAASYIVPEDRDFIRQVGTIVVATATGRCDVANSATSTCTTFDVEEVIKGPVFDREIKVVEPSGSGDHVTRIIPGMPTFEIGERVLLMLRRRSSGSWIVSHLALGKFTFRSDVNGTALLVREEAEIWGWDSHHNTYQEKHRGADAFLAFVRAEVAGEERQADYFVDPAPIAQVDALVTASRYLPVPYIAPFTATSYTSQGSPRWNATSVSYFRGTTDETGAPGNGVTAINVAMSGWSTVTSTNLALSYNGTQTSDFGLCDPSSGCPSGKADGKNTIQFERDISWAGAPPFTCTPSSYSGVLGIGGMWTDGTTFSGPNSEIFAHGVDGDVEMNKGIAGCTLLFGNGDFNTAVAHEVGHSIGFRHSDQGKSQGSVCDSNTMECSSTAIMKAFITQNINGSPRTYDQHAMQAVYPGATSCTLPSILSQPAGSTITQGNSASLSVSATGTPTLTYQWYIGNPPTTSSPVAGGTTASISVSPSSTTNYWVQVTNSCPSGSVNSNAATVTVNPCNAPQVTQQPSNQTIGFGGLAQLSVTASGTATISYQWYIGASGNTAQPVNGATSATLSTTPNGTTQYWCKVTNSCGSANSNAATVTVTCAAPGIVTQPQSQSIKQGSSTFLSVAVSGGPNPTYQWYRGNLGDTSTPLPSGTTATISVAPAATTSYWVRIAVSGCGTVDSNLATVTVTVDPTCPAVTIANPTAVQNGSSFTLTTSASTSASGQPVTITWFDGNLQTVGTGNSISVSPTVTTTYTAQATNHCGISATATVTVSIGCVAPIVTTPADEVIDLGSSAAIVASATGSPTLHYHWFLGAFADTSHPVGTDSATFSTGSLTTTTSYWVQVTNDCGASNSGTFTVVVVLGRHRAVHH